MPEPIRIPFSGSTDSTGAATLTVRIRAAYSAVATINAQCSGNPNWAVSVNGNPLTYGNGPQVTLGPIATFPQETISIAVSNAVPSSQITGTITGTQHETLQDAALNYQPTPNAITVNNFQLQPIIGTITTVGNGDTVSQTFSVPTGALGIQFISYGGSFSVPQSLSITGDVTHDQYIGQNLSSGNTAIGMSRWITPDQNAICSVTSQTGPGQPAKVAFMALTFNPTVNARITSGTLGTSIGADGSSLLVSNFSATPAPWQAANRNAAVVVASVASGGTQTLISASSGVTLYLHDYSFSQDNANAAANWQLQDTSGSLISSWFDTNVRKVFASGDFGGFPITTGRGVQILNGGANASFIGGYLSYSI